MGNLPNREHPTFEQLSAFISDLLPQYERADMVAHLDQCVACREILAIVTPEVGPPAPAAVTRRKCA